MDGKEELREKLLKEQAFLKSLVDESSECIFNTIKGATVPQIQILIQVLHCVCKGEIKIWKEIHSASEKNKVLQTLHDNFSSVAKCQELLTNTEEARSVQCNLCNYFKFFLHFLFYQ